MSCVDKVPKEKASSKEGAEVNNGKPCIDFQPGDRWQIKEDEDSTDSHQNAKTNSTNCSNGRTLRSRSLRNSSKKDSPVVNGEGDASSSHKDTSKATSKTSSRKKANEESTKAENGKAGLKRKKSVEESSNDQNEDDLPCKAMKVDISDSVKKDSSPEVNEIDDDEDLVEEEDKEDEEEKCDEVVAETSPKEVVTNSSPPSSADSEEDGDSESKVVDLDSSIEMLENEPESADNSSSASEAKEDLSKDDIRRLLAGKTAEVKTAEKDKNADDDIEVININDDGKNADESDSECQIINLEGHSESRSDAQDFPSTSLSEKDVSLSAGYPYYNSLKEKISGFKAGDFKPVKFPHTGTLLLGQNEVIIESPSLLVPLLIKEVDEFPKLEGEEKKTDDDAVVLKPIAMISKKNFFQSSVGQFLINLGTSRVQEWYHRDMKRAKLKQLKTKKASEEDLEKAVEFHDKRHNELKEINAIFNFRMRQCKFCSFKTESQSVMEGHYLTPHLSPRREYKCNFCTFLTRDPGTIVFHFEAIHSKKAVLDANIPFHECVFCSFQSHLKTKVNVHMNRCRKHFIPSQNLAPPFDFEFPGVTTKPVTIADVIGHRRLLMSSAKNQQRPTSEDNSAYARKKLASVLNRLSGQSGYDIKNPNLMKQLMTGQSIPSFSAGSSIQLPPGIVITRPRGGGPIQQIRPIGGRYPVPRGAMQSGKPQYLARPGRPPLNAHITASQLASSGISITPVTRPGILPRTTNISGIRNVTLTPIGTPSNRNVNAKPGAPQPVALYTNMAGAGPSGLVGQPQTRMPLNMRPLRPVAPYQRLNTPPSQVVKGSSGNTFVVCEICDSYIKDLEELRTHMNWVHKVKIHPKMLVSRPPLNCQKCQWRFFTDQGLERHLLGAHGLVTTNMQEMANKNQDGGRCIICGAVFTYKLVSHMTQVHKVTLKPAHLSYKCTVCTATFTLYRLFESHVYNVHSGSAKRNAEESSSGPPAKKAAVQAGPKKCKECNFITDNMHEHLIKKHMKNVSVKLCRIEKCKKCLYKDEMLLIRMSDFGLEEDDDESSSGDSSDESSEEEEAKKETGKII